MYKNLKKFNIAIRYYKKAIKIREEQFGKINLLTSNSYYSFAKYYEDMNSFELAMKYYQKSFLARYYLMGENYIKTKTTQKNLQQTYLALGHTEQEFNQYLSDLLSNPLPPPTQED